MICLQPNSPKSSVEIVESEINAYLNSFMDVDCTSPMSTSVQRKRQKCCGTSRSIYCPECFKILLDKSEYALEDIDSKVKLPFSVDIILTDRRVASTGVHAVVLADRVRLIDYERDEAIPDYSEEEGVYILFPSPESVPLSTVTENIKKLVVLDCKWTKSSVKSHSNLKHVQKIHITNPPHQSQFWRWHNAGSGMLSTIEAIYVAAREAAEQLKWLRNDVKDLLRLLFIFGITRCETARSSLQNNKVFPFENSDKNRLREKLSYKGTEKQLQDREKGRLLKSKNRLGEKQKDPLKISIWIVPDAHTYDILNKQIHDITSKLGLPSFIPHVTLLGGIQCVNTSEIKSIVKLLKSMLKSFGDVQVEFSGPVTCARDKNTNEIKWNQSCLVAVKRTPQFMRLSHMVREVIRNRKKETFKFSDTNNLEIKGLKFPDPFGEPHYSFAYGNQESLCSNISLASSGFMSREVVVWITSPSSVEGVKSWRHFASISLV